MRVFFDWCYFPIHLSLLFPLTRSPRQPSFRSYHKQHIISSNTATIQCFLDPSTCPYVLACSTRHTSIRLVPKCLLSLSSTSSSFCSWVPLPSWYSYRFCSSSMAYSTENQVSLVGSNRLLGWFCGGASRWGLPVPAVICNFIVFRRIIHARGHTSISHNH